jgi:hypothetical protein
VASLKKLFLAACIIVYGANLSYAGPIYTKIAQTLRGHTESDEVAPQRKPISQQSRDQSASLDLDLMQAPETEAATLSITSQMPTDTAEGGETLGSENQTPIQTQISSDSSAAVMQGPIIVDKGLEENPASHEMEVSSTPSGDRPVEHDPREEVQSVLSLKPSLLEQAGAEAQLRPSKACNPDTAQITQVTQKQVVVSSGAVVPSQTRRLRPLPPIFKKGIEIKEIAHKESYYLKNSLSITLNEFEDYMKNYGCPSRRQIQEYAPEIWAYFARVIKAKFGPGGSLHKGKASNYLGFSCSLDHLSETGIEVFIDALGILTSLRELSLNTINSNDSNIWRRLGAAIAKLPLRILYLHGNYYDNESLYAFAHELKASSNLKIVHIDNSFNLGTNLERSLSALSEVVKMRKFRELCLDKIGLPDSDGQDFKMRLIREIPQREGMGRLAATMSCRNLVIGTRSIDEIRRLEETGWGIDLQVAD